jgi:phosphonoacetaldehyde hydrolase
MSKYKLIIFDWAGTIIDKGCKAPLFAFKKTLEKFNIHKSDYEIKRDMGLSKFTHLAILVNCETQAKLMYPELIKNMKEAVSIYSKPVEGINEVFRYLHDKNYYIGSTSGYTRDLLNIAIYTAKKHKMYIPYNIASDEVLLARPYKYMINENFLHFKYNVNHKIQLHNTEIIKIGDTIADVEEGRYAHLNIGITDDNIMNFRMRSYGAHIVVSDIREIIKFLK